jgi:hypothetical protein
MSSNDNALTPSEQKTLVDLLKKLKPGFLPFEIFLQVARLVTTPVIEFVPLRLNDKGQVEVLLLDRELWPHGLHTPGTVIRATDNENNSYKAFHRILDDELKGTHVSNPHYVGSNLHKSQRGMEQAQVFWVEVLGEPKAGEFHAVDSLPEETMDSQLKFIKLAADSFKKAKSKNA